MYTNWTLITNSAAWNARDKPSSLVYNNQIYVLGGAKLNGLVQTDLLGLK